MPSSNPPARFLLIALFVCGLFAFTFASGFSSFAADLCRPQKKANGEWQADSGAASATLGANGTFASIYGRTVVVSQGGSSTFQGLAVREGIASIFGGPNDRGTGGRSAFTHENLRKVGTGHAPADYFCALRISNLKMANTPILVIYGNRAIACRLADKGPYAKGRMIDISPATARDVGVPHGQGTPKVKIAIGKPGTPIGVPFSI